VVIMTSNIGSGRILEADPKLFESEDGREAISDVLLNELGDFFRPEFLNRIDDSVVFKPLTKDDLLGIVGLQLRKLGKMLAEREMTLDVTEAARKRIVDLGYEPALGARPVSRVILREIQNPLAQSILEGGDLSSGTIKIDLSGEAFTFEKA
jgi:ATP-dependent Clp protease ATP-binding subunit ClpB